MPTPGVSQDYTLPATIEKHPNQIPYSRIPVIASAVASEKVLENRELFADRIRILFISPVPHDNVHGVELPVVRLFMPMNFIDGAQLKPHEPSDYA